jgi:hypothetical protein
VRGALVPLILVGCLEPPRATCEVAGPHLLVASTDYQSGVLGAVALDGSCLAEPLAPAGTDPLLRAAGDRMVYADSSDGDAVRTYAPGAYEAPLTEFALPKGGNTHDVARSGDALVFARYDEAALTVTDLSGRVTRRVELDADADADGLPEADRFAWVGERLFVSLQRLDRAAGFVPVGPGRILELDPNTFAVLARHEVGPNPRLWPGRGRLLVATGAFFSLDGAVESLAPDGVRTVLATEAELGFDVTIAVDTDAGPVFLGLDPDDTQPSHLVCGDRHVRFDDWPRDAVTAVDGAVWGVSRPLDFAGIGAASAWTLEPDGCALDVVAEGFLLGPASVALAATGR